MNDDDKSRFRLWCDMEPKERFSTIDHEFLYGASKVFDPPDYKNLREQPDALHQLALSQAKYVAIGFVRGRVKSSGVAVSRFAASFGISAEEATRLIYSWLCSWYYVFNGGYLQIQPQIHNSQQALFVKTAIFDIIDADPHLIEFKPYPVY